MRAFALAACFGVSAVACSRRAPPEPARPAALASSTDGSTDAVASASDAAALPTDVGHPPDAASQREPLAGHPWQIELFAEGADGKKEKLGFLSVPLGAREARPIMIALHGGSDKPEWACGAWRGITEAYPFLVCPRGFGGNDNTLGWRTTADTSSRIARAVAATKAIFGDWVKVTRTVVIAGFSMGGSQAANLAKADPTTYERVVLSESAYAPEPVLSFPKAWAAGGGSRALFSCTTSGCEPTYRKAANLVAAHGRPARLNVAPTQAHGMWDLVVQSMRRDFPWIAEGAEGWEAYVPPDAGALPGKTELFAPK